MPRLTPLLAAALLASAPAFAQHLHRVADPARPAAPAGAMSDGEVRKVDKGAKKITIKHGPLANLEMPPMTMVFHVKDPAMLDQVKAGDAVHFRAEQVGGNYTVTEIKPKR